MGGYARRNLPMRKLQLSPADLAGQTAPAEKSHQADVLSNVPGQTKI